MPEDPFFAVGSRSHALVDVRVRTSGFELLFPYRRAVCDSGAPELQGHSSKDSDPSEGSPGSKTPARSHRHSVPSGGSVFELLPDDHRHRFHMPHRRRRNNMHPRHPHRKLLVPPDRRNPAVKRKWLQHQLLRGYSRPPVTPSGRCVNRSFLLPNQCSSIPIRHRKFVNVLRLRYTGPELLEEADCCLQNIPGTPKR